MASPDWGAVDSKLVRKSPAHYEDGVYLMAETNRFSEKKQMSRKGSIKKTCIF